jgi:hypothetical protein
MAKEKPITLAEIDYTIKVFNGRKKFLEWKRYTHYILISFSLFWSLKYFAMALFLPSGLMLLSLFLLLWQLISLSKLRKHIIEILIVLEELKVKKKIEEATGEMPIMN